jgi:hypothetical protein
MPTPHGRPRGQRLRRSFSRPDLVRHPSSQQLVGPPMYSNGGLRNHESQFARCGDVAPWWLIRAAYRSWAAKRMLTHPGRSLLLVHAGKPRHDGHRRAISSSGLTASSCRRSTGEPGCLRITLWSWNPLLPLPRGTGLVVAGDVVAGDVVAGDVVAGDVVVGDVVVDAARDETAWFVRAHQAEPKPRWT